MKNSKNKVAVMAIVAILGLNFHVSAQKHDGKKGPHAHQQKEQAFKNLDADQDGKISQEEFTAHAEKRFAKMDKDGDGFLSKEEMRKTMHQRPNPETMMKHHDANNDGFIDENEAEGPMKKRFAEIDGNGDGKLSLEELKEMKMHHKGQRRAPENR